MLNMFIIFLVVQMETMKCLFIDECIVDVPLNMEKKTRYSILVSKKNLILVKVQGCVHDHSAVVADFYQL